MSLCSKAILLKTNFDFFFEIFRFRICNALKLFLICLVCLFEETCEGIVSSRFFLVCCTLPFWFLHLQKKIYFLCFSIFTNSCKVVFGFSTILIECLIDLEFIF